MSILLRASRSLMSTTRPLTRLTVARAFSSGVPGDRKYTKSHEWIKVDEGVGMVGITEHAADAMGDIVFVDVPEVDKAMEAGDSSAAVESVKATSDIYTPVNGTIADANSALEENPELINSSPYEDGWIFKVELSDSSQVDGLLTPAEYEKVLSEAEESG